MSDRIFGGLGLSLAAFFIWGATRIELSFISDPVGPRTFPIIIALLLALASLLVLLRPDPAPDWPAPARILEILAAVAVMVVYALLLPRLGFVTATALAAAYLTWRLGTRILQAILAGVLTSLGLYLVFHLILGLSLAKGPFGL